jgi:hypothetical protein
MHMGRVVEDTFRIAHASLSWWLCEDGRSEWPGSQGVNCGKMQLDWLSAAAAINDKIRLLHIFSLRNIRY